MAGKRRVTPKVPGETAAPVASPTPAASEPVAGKTDSTPVRTPTIESVPRARTKDDNLPDQSEVDVKTITRPVLTKQGWVLPVERPGPQFAKG